MDLKQSRHLFLPLMMLSARSSSSKEPVRPPAPGASLCRRWMRFGSKMISRLRLLYFQVTTLLPEPRPRHGTRAPVLGWWDRQRRGGDARPAAAPCAAPLPPRPRFPQPLPGATSPASPPVPAPAAAAKISEELLSILILIGPFLIMMFLQQFQPIMVSQGY